VGADQNSVNVQGDWWRIAGSGSGTRSFDFPIPTVGNPTISSVSIDSVAETTATVTVTATPGANASMSTIKLEYGTTTSYGTTATVSGSNTATFNRTGLVPGTIYYYKVTATNNSGKSGSTAGQFKTVEDKIGKLIAPDGTAVGIKAHIIDPLESGGAAHKITKVKVIGG
jgi:hypothetical protein